MDFDIVECTQSIPYYLVYLKMFSHRKISSQEWQANTLYIYNIYSCRNAASAYMRLMLAMSSIQSIQTVLQYCTNTRKQRRVFAMCE